MACKKNEHKEYVTWPDGHTTSYCVPNSDVDCPPGYEPHSDGICYPIDCGDGLTYDAAIGACVPVEVEAADPCGPGMSLGKDGLCYPVDCRKGYVYDAAAGGCVKAPEDDGRGKRKDSKRADKQRRQIRELEAQIAKLSKSRNAQDRQQAQALERQRAQLAQSVAASDGSFVDLLETAKAAAPYIAGAAAVGGLAWLLYRNW